MSAFERMLSGITKGSFTVRYPNGKVKTFGKSGTGPDASISIHDEGFASRVMREGTLGIGEAYMDGWWDAENEDIVSVLGVPLLNRLEEKLSTPLKILLHLSRIGHARPAGREESRENIRSHYDVGNDLYELFLDENMGYTCGYQLTPNDTSEQLQDQKHERVCRKLQLKEGERLVDLGCGFGGMLRYAAKNYGIRGVGCTLSEGQHDWANRKIREEGLQDRIQVLLKDYRDMEGEFDKVVSIGMAEHVWDKGYGMLFNKAASLIPEGALGLVHAIGTTDPPTTQVEPWYDKYIFPGARLVRLEEFVTAAQEAGLTVGHAENLRPHYAETLRHWRAKFAANREKIRSLPRAYDERFLRMWDYYLQLSEATFRYGPCQLYQVLFYKGRQWTLPMQLDFD